MAESWAACDVSRSLRAMSLRANSSVLRSKSRLESTTATCAFAVWAFDSASAALAFSMSARARSTCASWLRTVALDDSRSAFAWFTFARKMSGSIRAMTWSFFTIESREGDPVVGQGLAFGVLGLGEGELRVGELQDGPDAGVESPLGQPEILLRGGHQRLRRLDPLLSLLDGDLRLLDVLHDVELGGLHARPRALEVRLRLLIPRDPAAAVEERPVQGQGGRPGLVERSLRAPVGAAARHIRKEVAKGLTLRGFGGSRAQLGLPVLGALAQRVGPERLPVDRHRLVDEVVDDLQGRIHVDRHRDVERDDRRAQRIPGSDHVDA